MEIWHSRVHFNLQDPLEHIEFGVYSAYDVVGRAGWRIAYPVQPLCEIWLVREGGVQIQIGEKCARLEAPALAVVPRGPNRDTRHLSGQNLSILGFAFSATLFGALDLVELLEIPIAPRVSPAPFEPFLTRMIDEARLKRAGYALAVHGLAQLAFVELLRALDLQDSPKMRERVRLAQSREIAGALSFVAANFAEPVTLSQMAGAAFLSPRHFARKFEEALGLSPLEYLRKFRLNQARNLLATSDQTAGKIALDCGFEDAAYFSRLFKREWGHTPGEFRKSLKREAA